MDPILDEVFGIGYPASDDVQDPNPVDITGEGLLELDFTVFDADDFE